MSIRQPQSPSAADAAAFLSRLPLFAGLSGPVLDEIADAARPQVWPSGKLLFNRGDPSTFLVAIERGHVRISLQTREGRELVLQHVQGGDTVGEIGVLDGSTRTADATVAATTRGYLIDGRRYGEVGARHPEVARAAIRHLCGLVRYTTGHIEAIALYGLEARLARFLLSSIPAAADGEQGTGLPLHLDLNQSEIADLIGSSRPKVNQALAALEQRGVITREGRTIRADRDKLLRIAALEDGV